eukprot:223730-Rhodomonas_salina.1
MEAAIDRVAQAARPIAAIDPLSLDEVAEDDKPLVQNVIYALLACKHPERLCTSWAVTCTSCHYIVTGSLAAGDFEINLVDLELIQSVSPFRILSVGVVGANDKCKIVVRITNDRQRIQLTQADIIITHKRRR